MRMLADGVFVEGSLRGSAIHITDGSALDLCDPSDVTTCD
jgi:hypothetical protein